MKNLLFAVAALTSLGACAQNSKQVAAIYVSPVNYQNISCHQLQLEAERVSQRASQASTAQDQQAGEDAALTAVSLVLFWPAAFFIGGDDATSSELARLKGEYDAIQQANIQKNCGINFG